MWKLFLLWVFIYYLHLFCAYIFGLLVVLSSVSCLDSWMSLFCLKEYFTLVSWFIPLPLHLLSVHICQERV